MKFNLSSHQSCHQFVEGNAGVYCSFLEAHIVTSRDISIMERTIVVYVVSV